MQIYRDQVKILDFLFDSEEPISGVVMSNMLNYGQKTLKKEIDILNNMCTKNGFEIQSIAGRGYKIRVYNKSLYEEFKTHVLDKYNLHRLYRNFSSERMHYIIRQLLINNNIYIQDIANDCGYSESTINRDMNNLKSRLAEYSLTIKNHTNKGMVLYGDEWNKRLALINEEYLFRVFQSTYCFEKDWEFDQAFYYSEGLKNQMRLVISKVLEKRNYSISYSALSSVANMVILTITRNKYSDELNFEFFSNKEYDLEKEIINEVIKNIPIIYSHDFSQTEILAIAAFLASGRVLRYNEYSKLGNHKKIKNYVEGFVQLLNSKIKIDELDLTQLKKDLCCEIYHLKKRTDIGIHATHHDNNQFTSDGIVFLDMCALLYEYLSKNTDIKCLPRDVVNFYYIFSNLKKEVDKVYRKKVVVVMREGYYAARDISNKFNRMSGEENIDVIPINFIELKNIDIKKIDCIATNIDNLVKLYPDKYVADVHYFRNFSAVKKIVKEILCREIHFKKNIFKKEDIYYAKKINDINGVYDYVENVILQNFKNKEEYIMQLKNKEKIFSFRRNNQIALFNTIGDILGKSFIKIIVLDKHFKLSSGAIRYIVVYNVKNTRIDEISLYGNFIGNLFRTKELILINDRDTDYETLSKIMYG
ncbi:MAG: helix-turn-helix domain-containing protein [Erysipelotrichaceae bacterium]